MNKIFTAIFFLAAGFGLSGAAENFDKWTDRLLPLPKEINITESINVPVGKIKFAPCRINAPEIKNAQTILKPFSVENHQDALVLISFQLTSEKSNIVPDEIKKRLASLPNKEQAYALISQKYGKEKSVEITITANTPTGLIFGAQTLKQLLKVTDKLPENSSMEIPLVKIIDWPDIRLRGFSSGGAETNLDWLSQWKLNYINSNVKCTIDENGKAIAGDKSELIKEALGWGIDVVPYTSHFDSIARSGLYTVLYSKKLKHLLPLLALEKNGKRSTRELSFSNPLTEQYIAEWLMLTAKQAKGAHNEIVIWLSESPKMRCEADLKVCAERKIDPYELEVETVVRAWKKVKEKYPAMKLKLLLTQGTAWAGAEEKIIKLLPADVGLIQYHGVNTYRVNHKEFITPPLTEFSKNGGSLGLVPIIQNAIQTVVPMSSAQYVQFRIKECVEKKLDLFAPFIGPNMFYYDYNAVAMAEYSWNFKGRSTRDFAKAYAVINNYPNPVQFSEWAEKEGMASWYLAESALFRYLLNYPEMNLKTTAPFEVNYDEKEYRMQAIPLTETIKNAQDGLAVAEQYGCRNMLKESEVTSSALEIIENVQILFKLLHKNIPVTEEEKKLAGETADKLDREVKTAVSALFKWNDEVMKNERIPDTVKGPSSRFQATANSLLYMADAAREIVSRAGVSDPVPEMRIRDLGEWSAADFKAGKAAISFDITKYLPGEGGNFIITIDHIAGEIVMFTKIQALVEKSGKKEVFAVSPDAWGSHPRVPSSASYAGVRLDLPRIPQGAKVILEIQMKTFTAGRIFPEDFQENKRICSGLIGIRQIWVNEQIPANRKSVIEKDKNTDSDDSIKIREKKTPVELGILSEGYGSDSLFAALEKIKNFHVFPIKRINPETLAECNVLLVPQQKKPLLFNRNYILLAKWVKQGGNIILFHNAVGYGNHSAVFPEIGQGITHPACDKLKVAINHPVSENLEINETFSPGFKTDHVVMSAGPKGEIVLTSEETEKRPALIVGEYGKGKVILCGALSGLKSVPNSLQGEEAEPEGKELQVIVNSVNWAVR